MRPASVTIHYDLCKQCGRRVRMDRAIAVDSVHVHGEKRSASFGGCFCSPACLTGFVIGEALSVGVPIRALGTVPPEWNE